MLAITTKCLPATNTRGAALYIMTPRNLEFIAGDSIESRYSIGIAVYK